MEDRKATDSCRNRLRGKGMPVQQSSGCRSTAMPDKDKVIDYQRISDWWTDMLRNRIKEGKLDE